MKQLRIFSALLMCLFALGFTACGGGDDDETTINFEKADLYGGWKYESGESCRIYYFSEEDSSGIYIEDANLKNYDRQDIAYNINDEVTSLTINKKGGIIKYTILSLTDQILVIKDIEYEDTWTLKRYTGNIDKEFPVISGVINGHKWVDLGLSVKWATCNVGAKKPEEYGYYFAWGETLPKSTYTEENCKTYGQELGDISGKLAYDAARAFWGGSWRIPTKEEMQELLNNCTSEWTTVNGVNGRKYTSKINGNSIFLPAAGNRYGSSLNLAGYNGEYWSSTPNESITYYACYLDFYSGDFILGWLKRGLGFSVRPVTNK